MGLTHTPLSLDAFKVLDGGKVQASFADHLARAAKDCLDRPLDTKARKVTLQVDVVPRTDSDGACDQVNVQVQIKSTVPTHHTKVYPMALYRNGAIGFNPDSLDNPDQLTYLDDDEA